MEEMLLKILNELIDKELDNYIIADNIMFIQERERALDAIHYYEKLRKNLRKKMRKQKRVVQFITALFFFVYFTVAIMKEVI